MQDPTAIPNVESNCCSTKARMMLVFLFIALRVTPGQNSAQRSLLICPRRTGTLLVLLLEQLQGQPRMPSLPWSGS